MSSSDQYDPRNPSTPPQSIPLRDLPRPPDSSYGGQGEWGQERGQSLLAPESNIASNSNYRTGFERLEDVPLSPAEKILPNDDMAPIPQIQGPLDDELGSPIEPATFQTAIGFAGLSIPRLSISQPAASRAPSGTEDPESPSHESQRYIESNDTYFQPVDSDRVPLTDPNFLQPLSGAYTTSKSEQSHHRPGFHSVDFGDSNSRNQGSRLGDDLPGLEAGYGRSRSRSFGDNLSPTGRQGSVSPSASESPLSRAGSIMRAMSQRIVNLSNEPEPTEQFFRRASSTIEVPAEGIPPIHVMGEDTEYRPPRRTIPAEKKSSIVSEDFTFVNSPPLPPKTTNPFKGKSLGIFSPTNPVRMWFCDILVNPITEIVILILIVLQTVLLAVQSSSGESDGDIYTEAFNQSLRWGNSFFDYAILALFVIFTLEIAIRIIVSGFFFNAAEYSTIDRTKGFWAAMTIRYNTFFGPRRQASIRNQRDPSVDVFSNSLARSFTAVQGNSLPASVEELQRQQLARRAFLRHSLNRIDFIAVVSFWISFLLAITGIEASTHLHLFRMLSCLRILRLLYLTNGTSIILKSLKKAAPLLVNVSFLIGFFWLLFAIIGVQAFKSSFRRQCVWQDPNHIANYTQNFTLCGGYLDNNTGATQTWIYGNGTSSSKGAKGYICPRGSLCIEQIALYNGTVSFDDILHSLEMVFVIMSSNTFSDLMYYATDSDYPIAALYFAGGIFIMNLWLNNLLISVITSSFQVIRDESKQSAFAATNEPILLPQQSKTRKRLSVLKSWYDRTYWIWLLVILYGLVCQGMRSASMSQTRTTFINASETTVTFILLFEIIFRFAGDWRNFHKPRNLVDAFIAVITTIILLPSIRNSGEPYAWLTAFQIMRIYRVVWAVPLTRDMIAKVLGNAIGIGNLILFILLMTFLVSILAVQLFRGDIPPLDMNGSIIRVTFFSVYNSFLGMYQILSSENWTTILYNVTAYDNYLNTEWIGALFIIVWFILSFFILLNMFIAVIQENFDVSEDEKRLQQVKAFLQKGESATSSNLALSAIFRFNRSRKTKDPLDYGLAAMEMLLKDAVVRDFLDEEEMDPLQQNASCETTAVADPIKDRSSGFFLPLWSKFLSRVWSREPNPFYSSLRFSSANEGLDARAMAREAVTATSQRKKAQRDYLARHPTYNTSLFIFAPNNPIRRVCQQIVGPGRGSERVNGIEPNRAVWYAFSAFIYGAVATMVILACITTPLYQQKYYDPNSHLIKWFVWTDLAFATIFTVEALIKIIADGCFWTPNAYLRSLWGFIDGLVLVTLWIDVITTFLNDETISRAVGAFKALRALRLLNVSDTARDTFHAVVIVGGWRVLSAAFVSLSLLIPFALYGVNLFNGKLVTCNDSQTGIINLSDCVGEFNSSPFSNNWNMPAPRVAQNPFFDFDNFGHSLFILFQIISEEGWIDVMWAAQSITGQGLQPQNSASPGNAIFFIIFNLLTTVFVVTLFISVFMRTYTEHTGVAFLTTEQRSWMEMRKLLKQVAPSKRTSYKDTQWQMWCYKRAVKKHGRWHRAVTIILVMHLALLTLEYYPEPSWWTKFRTYIFLVFTIFYLANVFIRCVGLTWARYRRSSWDVFALISVSGTTISTILYLSNTNSETYYQLYKLFLVSITLLLIPRNNALDQLFKTAAASLTSISNLLATWGVLSLVFAIAMTQTFGLTRFGSQETNNINFRTVPKALILLFRMSIGEGWNQIMVDYATIQPPFCTTGSFFATDCGSAAWASILFISWNILSMYIFVSLFVSLIYESFSYVYQRSSGLAVVNREETRRFKQAWATFDPEGTGYILKEDFPRLLGELSGVFAMRIYDEEDSVRRILEDCQTNAHGPRGGSIASTSQAAGIDLKVLNERIARIDAKKVRERRYRFNLFYEEVMVSADPDRGISFTTVLMTLAHNNIISDSKSLKLEEFLRRRARLQRVEEEVRRRIVIGFFDTLFWHKRFRRYIDRQKFARMTDIPQFEVPEIIVDDEGQRQPSHQADGDISPLLSATHIPGHHSSFNEVFGFDGNYPYSETLSATSSPARSPRHAPHQPSNSGHGLDPQELGSPSHSRQGSTVSAENVLEVFTESAWGESLRRSFTMRRPQGDV